MHRARGGSDRVARAARRRARRPLAWLGGERCGSGVRRAGGRPGARRGRDRACVLRGRRRDRRVVGSRRALTRARDHAPRPAGRMGGGAPDRRSARGGELESCVAAPAGHDSRRRLLRAPSSSHSGEWSLVEHRRDVARPAPATLGDRRALRVQRLGRRARLRRSAARRDVGSQRRCRPESCSPPAPWRTSPRT